MRSKTGGQREFTTKSTKDTKNGTRWVVKCGNLLCTGTSGVVANNAGYYTPFVSFVVNQSCTSVRVSALDHFALVTHLK